MIALIKFEDDLFLDKKEAEDLNLIFKEVKEVGICVGGYKKSISEKTGSSYWVEELYYDKEESKYYMDETKEKPVSGYNVYETVPKKDYVKVEQSGNLVDIEDFAPKCRYSYSIEKCVKNIVPTMEGFHSILKQIEDKYEGLSDVLNRIGKQQFNEKVNVHVGGGLIVTYNELKLKENCCTDALQQLLNDGWRIISVCIQPDQRRPDYVLGRYNPNFDLNDMASR